MGIQQPCADRLRAVVKSGVRKTITEFAEELGINRSKVEYAIRVLESEGLIEVVDKRVQFDNAGRYRGRSDVWGATSDEPFVVSSIAQAAIASRTPIERAWSGIAA